MTTTVPGQGKRASLTVRCLILVAAASVQAGADPGIAALRRSTAPFHSIDVAWSAGWSTDITGCLDSAAGGQGHHYANFDVLLDAEVDPLRPETLLYEPREDGSLRLVAVEYVIPEEFLPSTAEPPALFGQEFHFNGTFGVWALHVWAWRHNRDGMFADWNPKVSCALAN